jgi:hypothetical protein
MIFRAVGVLLLAGLAVAGFCFTLKIAFRHPKDEAWRDRLMRREHPDNPADSRLGR